MSAPPTREVVELAARGRKIEAIKAYRAQTGAGLAEAKAVVEGLDLSGVQPAIPTETEGDPRSAWVLGVTVLGAIATLVLGSGVIRTVLTHDWVEVQATVLQSRVERASEAPSVELEYRYEFEGTEYRGDRISYAQIWGPGFTASVFARYPAGAQVSAWVDPQAPARAVLERRVSIPYYLGLFVSAAALMWGIASWRELAHRERESARRLPS